MCYVYTCIYICICVYVCIYIYIYIHNTHAHVRMSRVEARPAALLRGGARQYYYY